MVIFSGFLDSSQRNQKFDPFALKFPADDIDKRTQLKVNESDIIVNLHIQVLKVSRLKLLHALRNSKRRKSLMTSRARLKGVAGVAMP